VEVSFRPVGGAEGWNSSRFLPGPAQPNNVLWPELFFLTDQNFLTGNAVFWVQIGPTKRGLTRHLVVEGMLALGNLMLICKSRLYGVIC
jgi:hypothetical protein